jgi:multiple sugar transport system ATP-binding protein
MTMGDRIVVLKDGIVQQIDSPLNLYNNPNNLFVAGFIGSPAMNFIHGELEQKESLYFKSKIFNFPLPVEMSKSLKEAKVKDLTLGVRPENIHDIQTSSDPKALSSPQKVGIDVVEPIGNELYLYLNQDHQTLCMRTTADRIYHAGDTIDVGFLLKKLHFFETETAKKVTL